MLEPSGIAATLNTICNFKDAKSPTITEERNVCFMLYRITHDPFIFFEVTLDDINTTGVGILYSA